MKQYGIEPILKHASNEKIVGIRFKIGEESIKASAVDRSFSAARLQKLIQQNVEHHNRNNQAYPKYKINPRKIKESTLKEGGLAKKPL